MKVIVFKRVLFVFTLFLFVFISAYAGGKTENTQETNIIGSETSKSVIINQLDAESGVKFISENKPFILDVRTKQEYDEGHLKDSYLLPVQVLQDQLSLIEEYKNKDVFVYCRSGNRSMAASRILLEAGFTRIYNLQDGIRGWIAAGKPVVK